MNRNWIAALSCVMLISALSSCRHNKKDQAPDARYTAAVIDSSAEKYESGLIDNESGDMVLVDLDQCGCMSVAHFIFNEGRFYFTAEFDSHDRVAAVYMDDVAWKFDYDGHIVSYLEVRRNSGGDVQFDLKDGNVYRTILDWDASTDLKVPKGMSGCKGDFYKVSGHVFRGINQTGFVYDAVMNPGVAKDASAMRWLDVAVSQVNKSFIGQSGSDVGFDKVTSAYTSFRSASATGKTPIAYAEQEKALNETAWSAYCRYWERKYLSNKEVFAPYMEASYVSFKIVDDKYGKPLSDARVVVNDAGDPRSGSEYFTNEDGICFIPLFADSRQMDELLITHPGYSGYMAKDVNYSELENGDVYVQLEGIQPCADQEDSNPYGSGLLHAVRDYNMMVDGGSFNFSYFTDSAPDHIFIYDGTSVDYAYNKARLLWEYDGATDTVTYEDHATINFTSRNICVIVDGGTHWGYIVRCPR